MTPEMFRGRKFFLTGQPASKGRISIYQRPIKGHLYVAGSDHAYGLDDGDADTCCVIDKTHHEQTGIARQVAEMEGKWGESFDVPLYQMLTYYNGAFLLGERQVGLFTLRRLWDAWGYKFMYRQKDEHLATRTQADNAALGWHRSGNDLTFREARALVRDRAVEIRSHALLDQMGRLQLVPKGVITNGERDPDETLKLKLRGGGSPDLCVALMYALRALREVYVYDESPPAFAPGSYGQIFDLERKLPGVFGPKPNTSRGWLPDTMSQP